VEVCEISFGKLRILLFSSGGTSLAFLGPAAEGPDAAQGKALARSRNISGIVTQISPWG
jgi:hypothetical protein